jgi:succinyl-CoA synthetase beta subunit
VNRQHQIRLLNLHEYQSKELMAKFGVNTQKFKVADTPRDAEEASKELG